MTPLQIIILVAVIILLGVVVLPIVNRKQFKKLPVDQQVLTIMKQAKKLVFFKNVSNGRTGNLFYVKNKRKILVYPWALDKDGRMVILKENPFDNWNYPEEKEPLNDDEIKQAREELLKYSDKSFVKILFNDSLKENENQSSSND